MFRSSPQKRIARDIDKITSMKEEVDSLSWGRVLQIGRQLQDGPSSDQLDELGRELASIAQSNLSMARAFGFAVEPRDAQLMASGVEVVEGGLASAAKEQQEALAAGLGAADQLTPKERVQQVAQEAMQVSAEQQAVAPDAPQAAQQAGDFADAEQGAENAAVAPVPGAVAGVEAVAGVDGVAGPVAEAAKPADPQDAAAPQAAAPHDALAAQVAASLSAIEVGDEVESHLLAAARATDHAEVAHPAEKPDAPEVDASPFFADVFADAEPSANQEREAHAAAQPRNEQPADVPAPADASVADSAAADEAPSQPADDESTSLVAQAIAALIGQRKDTPQQEEAKAAEAAKEPVPARETPAADQASVSGQAMEAARPDAQPVPPAIPPASASMPKEFDEVTEDWLNALSGAARQPLEEKPLSESPSDVTAEPQAKASNASQVEAAAAVQAEPPIAQAAGKPKAACVKAADELPQPLEDADEQPRPAARDLSQVPTIAAQEHREPVPETMTQPNPEQPAQAAAADAAQRQPSAPAHARVAKPKHAKVPRHASDPLPVTVDVGPGEGKKRTRASFGRFRNLYESNQSGLCVFEDADGHLVAVDSSKLA